MKTRCSIIGLAKLAMAFALGMTGRGEAAELLKSEMTATASDFYSATTGPGWAIDGTNTTFWRSDASFPKWIQVDLGNWCLVDSIELLVTARGIKNYQVFIADEPAPGDWGVPIAEGQTPGGSSFYPVVFEPTAQGRYLRIVALSTHYDKNETRLYELNMHGSVAIGLADLQTGSTRFTNSNKLEVAAFPSIAGYDRYQFTGTNGQASAIDPQGWISTDDVPEFVEFAQPDQSTNVTIYAWYTNKTASVELRQVIGRTLYTTNKPVAAVHAQLTRYIVPGETSLRFTFQDATEGGVPLDAGTTGGDVNGSPIPFLTPGLSCPQDTTPDAPYVTLDSVGTYDITLMVTNEAGNVDSAVCQVTVEARTAPFLYVSPDGDNSTGLDWASAFTDLPYAQSFAASNDTLCVAGRTFWLSNQIDWVQSHIRIAGGYEATETDPESLPGARDPERWPTVFARSAGSATAHRILQINGATNVTLEHVTLTGGNLANGAGLWLLNSQSVLLAGCIVTNNAFRQYSSGLVAGGGIRAQSSALLLTNCIVSGNTADNSYNPSDGKAQGGGIWSDGVLTILDSRIQNNSAWTTSNQDRPAEGRGGGIYFAGTSLLLKNVLLAENDASGSGHGLYVAAGTVELNQGSVVFHPGEGIRRAGGTVVVTNSIVWGNWTDIEGAVTVSFSNVGDTDFGGDNLSTDPRFEYGYYLAAGSPCLGAGSDTSANLDMDAYVRNIQGNAYGPGDTVNLGYHYPAGFDLTYANLYVATDGDNVANDGLSAGSPFRTVAQALSRARAGTRIHLATGVYSAATTGDAFPLLVADKPGLRIEGADADTTILSAGDAGPGVLSLVRSHRSVLANVTLTGGKRVNGAGLRVERSQQVRLENCTITGNAFATGLGGTYSGGGAYFTLSDVTLSGCRISNNTAHNTRTGTPYGETFGGGIWSDGYLTLRDCRILDNKATKNRYNASCRGGGLGFSGWRLDMKNVLLAGNDAECLASPGSLTYGDGLHVGNVYDERLLNVKPDQVELTNITVADNKGEGIRRVTGAVAVTNSILWGNGVDSIGTVTVAWSCIGISSDYGDGGHNLAADPLFVDAAAGDYRLLPLSPTINQGLKQAWMSGATDLDGNPRVAGGGVDMGCYETAPITGTLFLIR